VVRRECKGFRLSAIDQRTTDAVRLPASGIRVPASGIRHPASAFRHPTSGIRHPRSDFRQPQSAPADFGQGAQRPPGKLSRSERTALASLSGLSCDLAIFAYLAALPLRESAPDTELLARNDCKLQTFASNRALATYSLGRASRCASLREEKVRIGTSTAGKFLPCHVNAFGLKGFNEAPEHKVSYNRVITSLSFK